MKDSYDYGLKLFLDNDDLERLYDFEEESMEGLAREREAKLHMSTEERVRVIGERLDAMGHKFEDAFQKAGHQNQSLQSLDFRLRRLEDATEQINMSLSVIHRFISSQSPDKMLMIADDIATKGREKNKSALDVTSEKFSNIFFFFLFRFSFHLFFFFP